MVVCTNREQGSVTPIYRTWPERFAWGYIPEIEHFVHCIQTETPPKVGARTAAGLSQVFWPGRNPSSKRGQCTSAKCLKEKLASSD